MIFDFKEKLDLKLWDKSDLAFQPPKSFKDYLSDYKSYFLQNIGLFIPFVFLFFIIGSLKFYSSRLKTDLLGYEESHFQYQAQRTLILSSKRDLGDNKNYIASLAPLIRDSIYPNLFLSLMSPIMPNDSFITKLSLSKDSSSIRIKSPYATFLSDIYSTLDQHPLIKSTDISFTSIKGPTDNLNSDSDVFAGSNEMEINFSYDFVDLVDLIQLFESSESESLRSKAELLQ